MHGFNRPNVFFTILLTVFPLSHSERRIVGGGVENTNRNYMVYFVKSKEAKVQYDAWLCGGAIVHPAFIITSAACLEDVVYMYAIAGYKHYLNSQEIYTNPCAMYTKRKIIMTCMPKLYSFSYQDVKNWATLDIAIAQVEKPYDFHDVNSYMSHQCSYAPGKIEINYDEKYQRPGTDAFVLGWGHKGNYREVADTTDYNSKFLQSAPVTIRDVSVCIPCWPENLHSVIRKYMICSNGSGSLDSSGNKMDSEFLKMDGCTQETCPASSSNMGRNGFCQNDHGGPLIGWAGGHEVLLGVQSAFMLTKDRKCIGPYLYTSTVCNSAFLDCVLTHGKETNSDCRQDNPQELGFTTVQRRISWQRHPDGPAVNELIRTRPDSNYKTEEKIRLRPLLPII